MNPALRLAPERQRRILALMGMEVALPPSGRVPIPIGRAAAIETAPIARSAAMAAVGPVVLRIAGAEDADPALLGAIVRALGLKAGEIAWTKPARAAPAGADSRDAGPRLPLLAFGTAPSAGVNLPPVAELRADPVAKRQAWRTLRALAKSLKVR